MLSSASSLNFVATSEPVALPDGRTGRTRAKLGITRPSSDFSTAILPMNQSRSPATTWLPLGRNQQWSPVSMLLRESLPRSQIWPPQPTLDNGSPRGPTRANAMRERIAR